MAVCSKIFILIIMTLALAACGGKLGQSESPAVFYSNKPATPFVMPEKPAKRIFTAADASFYLDEQGTPTTWGRQTCMPDNLVDVVSIAGGDYGSFAAVKGDGTVETWDCYSQTLPIPSDLSNVKALAVGSMHTLALKRDGTVEAWGVGPGVTKMPPNLRDVVAISAGKDHGLVLHGDGRVTAWDGQCCTSQDEFPQVDLSGVVAIASGESHNLALRADGTIVSWGPHSFYPLIPAGLTDEFGAIAIAVVRGKSYALLANGDLISWERSWTSLSVQKVKTLPGAVHISVDLNRGLAQKMDGSLMSWGYGLASLLPSDLAGGVINATSDLTLVLKTNGEILPLNDRPIVLGSDAPVVRVDADGGLSAAFHTDGTLSLWGFFILGEAVAEVAEAFADVKDVAFANGQTVVILKTDGTVFLRGINLNPQEAEFVASLRNIVSVQRSGGYFVALNDEGEPVAWRLHYSGELQIHHGPSMISAVAESTFNILMLRTDGTVAIWDPESSSVTDLAPELDDIVAIAGGYSTHLALKQDGTLISINAELPDWLDESAEQSTIPAGLKDIVAIYSKSSQAALTRDGQLIAWGKSHLLFDFYQLPE